jgi:hypothetical protein
MNSKGPLGIGLLLSAAAAPFDASNVALGQSIGVKMQLSVMPASRSVLGQRATVRVEPVTRGMTYRYVARMVATGAGMLTQGTACDVSQTIGSGPSVAWTPASGEYRLTLQASQGHFRDSIVTIYQVHPPTVRSLSVAVRQYAAQPGKVELTLLTSSRGPGHDYQWVVRLTSAPGAPLRPPVYWASNTPTFSLIVVLPVPAGTYDIAVVVGIHTGDPCRITEISRGGVNAQVIQ